MENPLVISAQPGCAPCSLPDWKPWDISWTVRCSWADNSDFYEKEMRDNRRAFLFFLYSGYHHSNIESLLSSNRATSASVILHPSAPAFCWACSAFFAPGMGSVPLQIVQFSATCALDLPP